MSDDGGNYVREHYKVAAHIGGRVEMQGRSASIVGFAGPHLLIRFDGATTSVAAHPTWEMRYLSSDAA